MDLAKIRKAIAAAVAQGAVAFGLLGSQDLPVRVAAAAAAAIAAGVIVYAIPNAAAA